MALLTAIITHLDAARVRGQLDYLQRLAPEARIVVCHGGARRDYRELGMDDALFVEDSSLRGPSREQSYTELLRAVYERFVGDDPDIELVYFIEYDHLIVASDFEQRLVALAERSPAGLFAKYASPRNDTNWPHFVRYRRDERLNRFFQQISRRDDPGVRFGCLGSGMLFRRDALRAIASVADPPHAYLEMFVPTLTYHLGFDVVDVDAVSDLYAAVRWRPEYTINEAVAEKRRRRAFVHPFKRLDALEGLAAGLPARRAAGSTELAAGRTRWPVESSSGGQPTIEIPGPFRAGLGPGATAASSGRS
jgi:hypothetical protein